MQELKKTLNEYAQTISDMKPTDTLVVHYAVMPVRSLSIEVLVRQKLPIELIPKIIELAPWENNSVEYALEQKLLKDWHSQFKYQRRKLKKANLSWVLNVDKVKLIPCNILTPIT
jgi:hypothetical protein